MSADFKARLRSDQTRELRRVGDIGSARSESGIDDLSPLVCMRPKEPHQPRVKVVIMDFSRRFTIGEPVAMGSLSWSHDSTAWGQSGTGALISNALSNIELPFGEREIAPRARAKEVGGGGPESPDAHATICAGRD